MARKKIVVAKGVEMPRGKEEKIREKPGSSNVGKYKKTAPKEFCGASGGSSKYSYPVDTKKRCHSALSYARNAPNPEGIRACVKRKCKSAFKGKLKD